VRPQLVFLHGIGGSRDTVLELKRWTLALAAGARRAGHSGMAAELEDGCSVKASFAYYGDLFAAPQAQGAGGLDLDDEAAGILIDILRALVDTGLAECLEGPERRSLEHGRAQLALDEQAQGAGNLVRQALNAATTLLSVGPMRRAGRWSAPKLMIGELSQVARYLARGENDADGDTLDQRIRARLVQVLGEGSAVVVSHSLGTVVALEALHECSAAVPLFVTLGSPVSMRTAVWPRLVPQPPRTPEQVGRWLNFWDRDDVIAARPRLEADVLPNTAGVRAASSRVDSDGLWVHSATKYLATPDVGGPVAEVLGSSPDPVAP
jgi:pimeloyl-ACP methyl ester carboxylesterase